MAQVYELSHCSRRNSRVGRTHCPILPVGIWHKVWKNLFFLKLTFLSTNGAEKEKLCEYHLECENSQYFGCNHAIHIWDNNDRVNRWDEEADTSKGYFRYALLSHTLENRIRFINFSSQQFICTSRLAHSHHSSRLARDFYLLDAATHCPDTMR